MADSINLDWLQPFAERWRQQERDGRAPHALLLLGAPGVGKRAAATWLAARRLAGSEAPLPGFPARPPEHPDLHWLTRLDDKHTIVIEQVRELVADLGLTSHGGRGKVAVIEPAQLLTRSAANSLLKTLEEPPGDVLLILVADRLGHLPPTILSRCQRATLAVPATAEALAWLARARPGQDLRAALDEAGGAPLAALALQDEQEFSAAMGRDLAALAARQASPVAVAGRWLERPPEQVLDWLCRQVQACIRRRSGAAGETRSAFLQDTVLQRMDSRKLFCYLDSINRVRAQAGGSWNPQLTLEGLLIDWAEGLDDCGREPDLRRLWPSPRAAKDRTR